MQVVTTDNKKERMSAIGQRIKDMRKQLGYKTQEDFACVTSTTRVAIASYEIGRAEPTAAFLQNLSKLGVDTNYILTGKSEQEMPDFDTYLTRMGVDDMMKTIIKGYMALPSDKRKTVKEYIESLAAEIAAKKNAAKESAPPADATPVDELDAPPTPTQEEKELPLDPAIEEEVAKFRARMYAREKTRRMFTGSADTESTSASENVGK